MTLKEVQQIFKEAYKLLPSGMANPLADLQLLAIGLQESKFEHRQQLISKVVNGVKTLSPIGPAVSFWQFEKGRMGGITHVLTHANTRKHAQTVCVHFGVAFDDGSVWEAMRTNDVLGACMARLLLYTDPRSLPAATDTKGAWDCYIRCWHPGKPHPETWAGYHAQARAAVGV